MQTCHGLPANPFTLFQMKVWALRVLKLQTMANFDYRWIQVEIVVMRYPGTDDGVGIGQGGTERGALALGRCTAA